MKESGILLHISSLPNDYGIGSLGKCARQFVDFLSSAGIKYWQILPVSPTSYGDSPYQSPSSRAGNHYFIDVDELIAKGLVQKNEVTFYECDRARYDALYYERNELLKKASRRFMQNPDKEYFEFCKNNEWLDDYALFLVIKNAHNGRAWYEWVDEYKYKDDCVLREIATARSDEIDFVKFTQYEFFRQWNNLRAYMRKKKVKLIGDMPIYVAYDSVEAWKHPQNFLFNGSEPSVVAGVPPDYFSADGQLWGNPVYDWQAHAKSGFAWWIDRLRHAQSMFDVVRIDHFRAFDSYYTIPYGNTTARIGEWREGPKMKLFNTAKQKLGKLNIIAEDLGTITDSVRKLVLDSGFPAMKVMQFGIADSDDTNEHNPKNYTENFVGYTGTHDNDTTLGWYNSLDDESKKIVLKNLKTDERNVVYATVTALMKSKVKIAVVPMQDVLECDSKSRMNTPGTKDGNWQYRLSEIPNAEQADKLYSLLKKCNRAK